MKKFCEDYEKIENYDKAIADKAQTWHCHHRMEAVYTREELIKYGLYYDREPHQLIFLTKAEHTTLHRTGTKHSEETREKIPKAQKGKTLPEETRKKMSESQKGRIVSWGDKISEAKKGHITTEETKKRISEGNKGKHVSEEAKSKISASRKGKHLVMIDGRRHYV